MLREVDRATGILTQFAACFRDARDPARITHVVSALVRPRVYGLALGYEDLNDHEQLRHDPLFAVLAEAADLTVPLAGKSTLNRLELSAPRWRRPSVTRRSRSITPRWIGCSWTCFCRRIRSARRSGSPC